MSFFISTNGGTFVAPARWECETIPVPTGGRQKITNSFFLKTARKEAHL
jgi:hypothetical protein